jgi:hypothetical protein
MKRSVIIIIISSVLFLFLFTTCRGVFYDEEAALDAILLSKMTKIADLGTFTLNPDNCFDSNDMKVFFLPDKNVLESNYNQTGFLIFDTAHEDLYIWYLDSSKSISQTHYQMPNNNTDDRPDYFLEPIKQVDDTPAKGLLYIKLNTWEDDGYINRNTGYNILQYRDGMSTWVLGNEYGGNGQTESLEQKIGNDYGSSLPLFGDASVHGAYISPSDQYLYILCGDGNGGTGNFLYFDVAYQFMEDYEIPGDPNTPIIFKLGALGSPYGVSPGTYTILDNPYREILYYFYDFTTNGSFMSFPTTSGTYENWYWKAGDFIAPNEFNETQLSYDVPMQRLLTTGEFLSYSGNTVNVYNQNGEKVNSFQIGNLHFPYEVMNPSGTYSMIFTYAVSRSIEPESTCSEREVTISVYSLPTTAIDTL